MIQTLMNLKLDRRVSVSIRDRKRFVNWKIRAPKNVIVSTEALEIRMCQVNELKLQNYIFF